MLFSNFFKEHKISSKKSHFRCGMQSSDEYTVEYANSEEPRERLLDQAEIFRKSRNLIVG